MSNKFLHSAIAKIKRSETQINDLDANVRALFDGGGYERASQFDSTRNLEIWKFRVTTRIPDVLPVIVGEVLHNIRSSLDNLACAIASNETGSTSGTYFPFGKDETIFERELARKCKNLPSLAREMIRAVKPYKGGNDLLFTLHDLNRADKHVRLCAVNVSTGANLATYLTVHRGLALVVGAECGQHLYIDEYTGAKPMPSADEIAAMPDPTAVYATPPGVQLSFGTRGCSAEKSLEFMTATPGAQFETDMKPTLQIAFRDVRGAETEPVIAVLSQMREATARIIAEFRTTFFP